MQVPSEEQQHIIDEIKRKKNVIVDACAGSGKSATILSVAIQNPDMTIIQITYNSMLRLEIKEKIKQLEINNIEVHTYHSLAVKYYLPSAHNDMEMRRILIENMNLIRKIPEFQLIVIDEAQDMTPLYFKLIRKFMTEMTNQIQLLILGDYMQGLYEFKGSDIRYLTKARELWQGFSQLLTQEFAECTLKMSYRITQQMANFVNCAMLGETRLYACKEGAKVNYIRANKYNIYRTVIYEMKRLMNEEGAKPSDFFILGASVKGQNNQIRRIENILVESGIPCHVPTMETDKIDDKVISKKVVFSTFHCVKGRQRKYVFIMGFDDTYMKYYGRTCDPKKCPNTLYVAATRATNALYVLERNQDTCDKPLSFLKMSHHEMKAANFIEFRGQTQTIFYDRSISKMQDDQKIRHHVTPTDLINFIPDEILIEIIPILLRIFIKETDQTSNIEIPTMVETNHGFHEDVSDLNGIAIPAMFYDYIESRYSSDESSTSNILYDIIKQGMANVREGDHLFLKEKIAAASPTCDKIEDYLYMANLYMAVQEKLYFKLQQITEYCWLTDEILGKCKTRLLEVLGKECNKKKPRIEETIIHYMDEEDHEKMDEILSRYFQNRKFRFSARTDIITYKTLWEIKCTTDITYEHMIQTLIYAWLHRMTRSSLIDVKLFNIRSGAIWRLEAQNDELTDIMVLLLKGKYEDRVELKDVDFVQNNREI